MPRYFFETDDDDMLAIDDEGFQLADDEADRLYAMSALPDMAREKIPDGDKRIFSVAVRNDTGQVIYHASLTLEGEWYRGSSIKPRKVSGFSLL